MIVSTGIWYALLLLAAGAVAGWATVPGAGVPFVLPALFCLWFFRDPERNTPPGAVAVSPADGKVLRVRRKPDVTELSIFMNVFDVHVNRAPIAGKVIGVEYTPGRFLVASQDAAMMENERNAITVEGPNTRITFVQVAGLIARRIVCWKKPGDFVTAGERVGLIKFGSRVDLTFDREWDVLVAEGERVRAGESVVAQRKGA
jgi:phosphatidylserine decarboxylase